MFFRRVSLHCSKNCYGNAATGGAIMPARHLRITYIPFVRYMQYEVLFVFMALPAECHFVVAGSCVLFGFTVRVLGGRR